MRIDHLKHNICIHICTCIRVPEELHDLRGLTNFKALQNDDLIHDGLNISPNKRTQGNNNILSG